MRTMKRWLALAAMMALAAMASAQPQADLSTTGTLAFSPTDVDDPASEEILTITNSGDSNLMYTGGQAVSINSPTGDFSFATPPQTSPQAPGIERDVRILFAPTGVGVRAGTLTINTNDPVNPSQEIALEGEGLDSVIALSTTEIDFGDWLEDAPASPPEDVVITNSGNGELTFAASGAVTLGGANPGQFQISGDTGETTLAADGAASRSVSVRFRPTSQGTKNATLTIRTDASDGAKQKTVSLTGRGVNAPFALSIEPATVSPTKEETLEWIVTFNIPVSGVDVTDFVLAATDLTTPTITAIYPDGEDSEQFIVTAARGGISGPAPEIGLNLIDDGTIEEANSNNDLVAQDGGPDGSLEGETFLFDLTPPAATLTALDPLRTALDSVRIEVMFDESVAPTFDGNDAVSAGTLVGRASAVITGPLPSIPSIEVYQATLTPDDPDEDGSLGITLVHPDRVTDGLIALYDFKEAAGRVVHDVSGVAPAMDLDINDRFNVGWLNGGGLVVNDSTHIQSDGPAEKLYDRIAAPGTGSGEITVEAYVIPDSLNQFGPARIVTMSDNSQQRNFTLAQEGDDVVFRLRTTTTGNNGLNPQTQANNVLEVEPVHLVATRTASGVATIYVNGAEEESRDDIDGNLSNWDDEMLFGLANEFGGDDRTWLGTLFEVAVYDRALTGEEVRQNFRAVQFVRDRAGNDATTPEPLLYDIDNGAPVLLSIERLDPERTSQTEVRWRVMFNDDVVNLITAPNFNNFTLVAGPGLIGSGILSITPADGPAREYVVTAATGPGSGLLRLDFTNSGTVQDIFGQGLATGSLEGESYIIDRTPPRLETIRRLDPNPTRQLVVRFEIGFSEPVRGVSSGDFEPLASGLIEGAHIDGITPTADPAVYVVRVDTGNGDGTVGLTMDETVSIFDFATPDAFPLEPFAPVENEAYKVDKNDAPVDITLSNNIVQENVPIGTVVGFFSTADFDPLDTHSYGFTEPYGDGNGRFAIVNGNELVTAEEIDFEAIPQPLLITVESTDNGLDTIPPSGLGELSTFDTFTIVITDVPDGVTPPQGWMLR